MPQKGKRKPRKRRPPKKKEPEEPPSEEDDLVESSESGGEVSERSGEDSGGNSGGGDSEGSSEGSGGGDSSESGGEPEEEPPKPPKKTSKKTSKKPATKKTSKKTEASEVGRRYFKILTDSIKPEKSPKVNPETLSSGGGRYTGNNPMQAAKKAFTRIARAASKRGACTYVFSIQETTQGSAKKVFQYRGVRQELAEPQIIKKGDTEYSIKFRSEVRSYKEGTPSRKAASKKSRKKH